MPISTMLVIVRLRSLLLSSMLLASHSCPMISALPRLRLKPCLAVAQNVQLSAQPTCEEMHRVPLGVSGMKTISTQLSGATRTSHLMVPSTDSCTATISGGVTDASASSRARRSLLRLVIAANRAMRC